MAPTVMLTPAHSRSPHGAHLLPQGNGHCNVETALPTPAPPRLDHRLRAQQGKEGRGQMDQAQLWAVRVPARWTLVPATGSGAALGWKLEPAAWRVLGVHLLQGWCCAVCASGLVGAALQAPPASPEGFLGPPFPLQTPATGCGACPTRAHLPYLTTSTAAQFQHPLHLSFRGNRWLSQFMAQRGQATGPWRHSGFVARKEF